MHQTPQSESVRCWEEAVTIPTYPVQDADPNPMFLEKRVYQGSTGRVYPNPFTDRVALHKVDKTYRAIRLENEHIQLMILPEIGGRIHAGLDKSNQYDFFYRQSVIKPALVGLLGPWISGGVEFNWPQHHRPSTYMPVHSTIEEHTDGSKTVWLSEHDPMLRMKGMVGIHLSPGKAIVEARVRLYNRTPLPQTFLWWANVAVRVHDQYQAFFPPDVRFVADHAKRAISSFPIARNPYYGVDYRPGTDISWYRNIPVPTSYMVTESEYDFFGGYDHARGAGLIHTSNHHIAPGKKLWTWGNAEFGYAWDRNLTDDDGPYVELMAGAYTDNQPDFSWLQPYETKAFSQFWYPIQQIGPAKNANIEAAINLELDGLDSDAITARIGVCITTERRVRVLLTCEGRSLLDEQLTLLPGQPMLRSVPVTRADPLAYRLIVFDDSGEELIAYQPQRPKDSKLPEPAIEPPPPEQIASCDELYLTGLHLEQYRHATRSPEPYWQEGLRRDANDARINNAMGLRRLRSGEFVRAEEHFARAVDRLTSRNPNPRDGEAHYNLGLAFLCQGKLGEAFNAFHKCVWNQAWQSAGFYALACISTRRGQLAAALDEVKQSRAANPSNLKAAALHAALLRNAALLRQADCGDEARTIANEALAVDPLDFRLMAELVLGSRAQGSGQHEARHEAQQDALPPSANPPQHPIHAYLRALDGDLQTLLDVTYDLAECGLYEDAWWLLRSCVFAAEEASSVQSSAAVCNSPLDHSQFDHPMIWFTLAWLAGLQGDASQAKQCMVRAEAASAKYCFPARIEEMIVLEDCLRQHPALARAQYYLGNLYYDKQRYLEAIQCWRRSVALDPSFSVPWRNLGIAEFNVLHNPQAADQMYRRAFAANADDARLLYEWDQLKKRARLASPDERLRTLQDHPELVARRDDLAIELITLLNQQGQWQAALDQLTARQFSPWEGGEGLVSAQYVNAHRALAIAALLRSDPAAALQHLRAATTYPHNLGEGKHLLTLECDLDYLSGVAAAQLGDAELACKYWQSAAADLPKFGVSSYFQAVALRALGQLQAAKEVLLGLRQYAETLAETEPKIDYFATSLPNLLLFDDDLVQRNRTESLLLTALANHGLGDTKAATGQLEQVVANDPNHLFAAEALEWIRLEAGTFERRTFEARTQPTGTPATEANSSPTISSATLQKGSSPQ